VSTSAAEIGMPSAFGYQLFEFWTKAGRNTTGAISATVAPHGVVMYRVRTGATTPTDTFSLRGAGSGRCLDVLGAATANNTTVILWTCSTAANQRWTRI
jgi:alpha-galactosidase